MNKLFNHTSAFTFGTLGDVFTTLSIAFLTVSISFDFNILHGSVVNFIERDLNFDKLGFGLSWAGLFLTASSEETENVPKAAASSRWTAILDTLFSVFIVQLSLLWVGESLVGVGDFFEFIGVSTFVGVFLQGFSSERLSDLLGGGLLVNSEKLIVLGCVDLFLLSGLLLLAGHSATESSEPSKAWESS